MPYKKTSILFVNTQGKENKILQIPTKILLNWKKYFFFLFSCIFILTGVVAFLVHKKTSEHYEEELAKANRIKTMINIPKVRNSLKSIDESLSKINKFMYKRGLQKIKPDNVGGEENFDTTDINELSEYYEKRMEEMEKTLAEIPLGAPHPGRITSTFGYRKNPFTGENLEAHKGIDFKAKTGDPVKTTARGIVLYAGLKGGYGNCVILKHSKKLKTLYGHLSKITVQKGQKVEIGDIIGKVGSTGRSTGPHVHYEVILNERKINPIEYVRF